MNFPEFYHRGKKLPYKLENNKYVCEDVVAEIKNNIPRFVPDGSYASLFGDQWKHYKKTQLDSYSGTSITADRLNLILGSIKDELDGKTVLEAGCGAGRFTEVLLQKGASLVSSDLSEAVEVNAENFPISEKHLVIQADINNMPFADESFDVVVCVGVIQHTPDSEKTIEDLYKLVKKGGYLAIDHYAKSRSFYFRLAPLYRRYLKKMPAHKTLEYTTRLVDKHLPIHKKFASSRLMSMLWNRISPVISYYRTLPQLNDEQQYEWALLDTHDSLTDWFKRFRTKTEIYNHLQKLGATEIKIGASSNGTVEALCRKG